MHVIRCDCCGKEGDCNKFSYLCHLEAENQGVNNAYVDNDGNPISSRMIEKDFCNKCYNYIVGAAIDRFRKLKIEQRKQNKKGG